MSSILREALAVFASCAFVAFMCQEETQKDLQKKDRHGIRQPNTLYSSGCLIIIPEDHRPRVRSYATRTLPVRVHPAFFAQPGSEAENEPQTARLAQIKTRSVPLPRKYGTRPKQNSPGWSLGCATSLLMGQIGAISNRYNGEWAKDNRFRRARQAFNCLALVSVCYWRPICHEAMVSLQFLVSTCQHHYHSEHPSSWSYQRSQGLSGKKGWSMSHCQQRGRSRTEPRRPRRVQNCCRCEPCLIL